MASKLTQQQREDLNASHGQRVPIENEKDGKVHYLVGADYLHFSHEHLRALIQQGISAPRIPAEQAEADLQSYADALAGKQT